MRSGTVRVDSGQCRDRGRSGKKKNRRARTAAAVAIALTAGGQLLKAKAQAACSWQHSPAAALYRKGAVRDGSVLLCFVHGFRLVYKCSPPIHHVPSVGAALTLIITHGPSIAHIKKGQQGRAPYSAAPCVPPHQKEFMRGAMHCRPAGAPSAVCCGTGASACRPLDPCGSGTCGLQPPERIGAHSSTSTRELLPFIKCKHLIMRQGALSHNRAWEPGSMGPHQCGALMRSCEGQALGGSYVAVHPPAPALTLGAS